jgi:hypothetical protein
MVYYVETNSVSMLDFALDKVGREDGWNNLVYVGLISSYQVDRMAGIRFMSIRHYASRERAIESNGPIEKYGAIFITEGNGEFPKVVKCQRTIKGSAHEITVSLEYDGKKLSKGTILIDNYPSWKNRYFKDVDEFRKELNFFKEVKSISLCYPDDIKKLIQFIDGDASCFNEDWDVARFIFSRCLQAHSN